MGVNVGVERLRSGKGALAWIFFSEPVPARAAGHEVILFWRYYKEVSSKRFTFLRKFIMVIKIGRIICCDGTFKGIHQFQSLTCW
jgi:hypothetical protein